MERKETMSKCISSHGEYSEHEGPGEYCDWCGDCNHAAIKAAAEQRGELRAAKNLLPFVARVAVHRALIGTETAREAKLLAYELTRLEGDDE